ncbi:unnamed protein product [Symbiodinium sp. KB8]|nr:unnamed protein product [Symbiodinium sp. KB8]
MAAAFSASSTVALLGPVPDSTVSAAVSAGAAAVRADVASASLLKPGSFTHVVTALAPTSPAAFAEHLPAIKALLAPGGTYQHTEPSGRQAADVSLELLVAGFQVQEPLVAADGAFTLTASVPAYDTSAAAALPPKTATDAAAAAWGVTTPAAGAAVVDEDALLAGDDAADAIKAPSDCSTKPRACANCSCGRAEAEAAASSAAVTLSEDQLQSFTSACGNCYKGDAFRCASCPHRGKPAFKPGMEGVMLDLGTDDVGGPIAVE